MVNVIVGVLVDGVYGYMDGSKMCARPGKAGQLLSVAGGAYVQSLVDAGMVTVDTGIGAPPADDTTPAPAPITSSKRARKGR